MNRGISQIIVQLRKSILLTFVACASLGSQGCEVDSFFNPSVTGRYKAEPTTVPILERIDVIEKDADLWGDTTSVTPDDLLPSDLTYRISPGDVVTAEIYELYRAGAWTTVTRRVDATGTFRLPELGDVPAAGLTAQEFEDLIAELLRQTVTSQPLVDVVVEEGAGFQYTVYGYVTNPGPFLLRDSAMTMLEGLAAAGGVPVQTDKIYVIRQVALSERMRPAYLRNRPAPTPDAGEAADDKPVDIEELIEQLQPEGTPPSPGMMRQDSTPPVDVDDTVSRPAADQPQVDVDDVQRPSLPPGGVRGRDVSYIYDAQRGEWVPVTSGVDAAAGSGSDASAAPLVVERVIQIPYQKLSHGDMSYNIVIRPDDLIYVAGPEQGVVYIDGEIVRPGVYGLPTAGRLTLSRLVSAAGGLGPLAIPGRVDLTRIVGENREATIRFDLQAIRRKTEPDLYLKPDDHIIIGTNFWAAPLAVFRNGFRATYGWGFLLDRNFGSDVFGPPPRDVG